MSDWPSSSNASLADKSDEAYARIEICGPIARPKIRAVAVFLLLLGTATVLRSSEFASLQWFSAVFAFAALLSGIDALYKAVQFNPTAVLDDKGITLLQGGGAFIVPWQHLKCVAEIGAGYHPMLGITLDDRRHVRRQRTVPKIVSPILYVINGLKRCELSLALLLRGHPLWRDMLFKHSLDSTMAMNEQLAGCHLVLDQYHVDRPVAQFVKLVQDVGGPQALQAEFKTAEGAFTTGLKPLHNPATHSPAPANTDHPPVTPQFKPLVYRSDLRTQMAMIILLIAVVGLIAVTALIGDTSVDNPAWFIGIIALAAIALIIVLSGLIRSRRGGIVLDKVGMHIHGRHGTALVRWSDIESITQGRATTGWAPSIKLRSVNHVVFLYWKHLRWVIVPTFSQGAFRLNIRCLNADADRLLTQLQQYHQHFTLRDEFVTADQSDDVSACTADRAADTPAT